MVVKDRCTKINQMYRKLFDSLETGVDDSLDFGFQVILCPGKHET